VTRRVYLHVGLPKSGTTYLQSVLRANRAPLRDRGHAVVGQEHVDLVHAGMVVREDPRLEKLPERASRAWQRLLDEIRDWPGDTAIVSYELLAGATAEQAARAIGDLSAYDVHVVITARDLGRALPSAWQERLKFALTTPLEDWEPRPETDERSEWGWRTLDPAGVAERWGGSIPSERLHMVTMPRGGRPEELWRRFAEACEISDVDVEFPDGLENTSLGAAAAEVLRRVNEVSGPPISDGREQARWLRDTLAHEILAGLDDEPMGLTDAQFAEALERSEQSRARLEDAGHTWHGDPDDLTPTRRDARTPGEVDGDRLLRVAVDAIWQLLLALREERRARTDEPVPARPGPRQLVRAVHHGVLLRENQRLQVRLDELEEQLRQSRMLQHRIASVTDLVTELLLPLADQDPDALAQAVRTYRKESS
jgi:hypothetical protein